jgi:hypothetical protein
MDNRNGASIFIKFDFPKHKIYYIIEATNQEEAINAINSELRLVKGRIYYIPINNMKIDSDDYSYIKVFSDVSDKLKVVFVKEGFACIIPILNNVKIKSEQRICNIIA